MLILTRKINEKITITIPDNNDIVIKIAQIGYSQVKIGIEAPKKFLILRDELIDASGVG